MFLELLFPLLALSTSAAASSSITVDSCLLGEPYSFSRAQCRIRVHNAGDRAESVQLSAQGAKDSVTPAVLTVPAKGSAEATVDVDVGNTVGRFSRGFKIHPETGKDAYVVVNGLALSALDEVRPEIAFGDIDSNALPIERSLTLSSHDGGTFRVTKVLDSSASVDVNIAGDGSTLRVRLQPDAPFGITDSDIKLAIDSPHQHEAWVHVSADIKGEVVLENNPFWFGSLEHGMDRHVLIPLTDRAGRELHIGHIDVAMIKGHADAVPCENKAPSCKAIRLEFDDSQRAGLTRAELNVDLPDLKRHLIVRVWGLLQNAAKRKDSAAPLPMPAQEDFSAPWTEGIVDSVNAPVYAVPTADPLDPVDGPPPPTEAPPGAGPLLHWKIVGEAGAYGYQIFRADNKDGPFVLQNRDVIRVHSKDYADTPYFWRDPTAVKGTTYWYYIGVVYKDGHKQVLSAPQSKVAQ